MIQIPPSRGLILQPDDSPISVEQLQAEVKGIYAGLTMVEARCININTAQAADPQSHMGPEQWQALIALHRTLLYEHHDFLMATQHPLAAPQLRNLALKYSMPARMWKHGIHTFLEVLRRRRPESQDYMLSFIYAAYQMMALLFETVPTFHDTWIECVDDLARYRMAFEEDQGQQGEWSGTSARWYTMASDQYPALGRLHHHIDILERPSLRKIHLYSTSLARILPFPNARDSLATLCAPIVLDNEWKQCNSGVKWSIVDSHAPLWTSETQYFEAPTADDAVYVLQQYLSSFNDISILLGVFNVSVLFDVPNAGRTFEMVEKTYIEQIEKASNQPEVITIVNILLLLGSIMRATFRTFYACIHCVSCSVSHWYQQIIAHNMCILRTIRVYLYTQSICFMVPHVAAAALFDVQAGTASPIGELGFGSHDEFNEWLIDLSLTSLAPFLVLLMGALFALVRSRNTTQQYQTPKRSRVLAGGTAVASCIFLLTDNHLGPIAASMSIAFQMRFMAEQCFDVRNAKLYVTLDAIFATVLTLLVATVLAPATTSASADASQVTLVIHTAISIGPGINALVAWLLFLVLRERRGSEDLELPTREHQRHHPGAEEAAADDAVDDVVADAVADAV